MPANRISKILLVKGAKGEWAWSMVATSESEERNATQSQKSSTKEEPGLHRSVNTPHRTRGCHVEIWSCSSRSEYLSTKTIESVLIGGPLMPRHCQREPAGLCTAPSTHSDIPRKG
jgi:hypothetical protein